MEREIETVLGYCLAQPRFVRYVYKESQSREKQENFTVKSAWIVSLLIAEARHSSFVKARDFSCQGQLHFPHVIPCQLSSFPLISYVNSYLAIAADYLGESNFKISSRVEEWASIGQNSKGCFELVQDIMSDYWENNGRRNFRNFRNFNNWSDQICQRN